MGESLFTVLFRAIRVNRSACQVCQTEKKKTWSVKHSVNTWDGSSQIQNKTTKKVLVWKKGVSLVEDFISEKEKMTNNYIQIYSIEIFQKGKFLTWQQQDINCVSLGIKSILQDKRTFSLQIWSFHCAAIQFVIRCTVHISHGRLVWPSYAEVS